MPALISGEEQKSAIEGYKEEETGPNLNEPLGRWVGWHDRYHSKKTLQKGNLHSSKDSCPWVFIRTILKAHRWAEGSSRVCGPSWNSGRHLQKAGGSRSGEKSFQGIPVLTACSYPPKANGRVWGQRQIIYNAAEL